MSHPVQRAWVEERRTAMRLLPVGPDHGGLGAPREARRTPPTRTSTARCAAISAAAAPMNRFAPGDPSGGGPPRRTGAPVSPVATIAGADCRSAFDCREFLKAGAVGAGGYAHRIHGARHASRGLTEAGATPAATHVGSSTLGFTSARTRPSPVHSQGGDGAGDGRRRCRMLLAEELECDWTKVRTEFPGPRPALRAKSGRLRQQQHPVIMDPLAARGGDRTADAGHGGRGRAGHVDAAACRVRERRRHQHRDPGPSRPMARSPMRPRSYPYPTRRR